jgi:hypothetical protein
MDEKMPRTRRGKDQSFGVLRQSFRNGNKTRILADAIVPRIFEFVQHIVALV